jgi:hypothetical protein
VFQEINSSGKAESFPLEKRWKEKVATLNRTVRTQSLTRRQGGVPEGAFQQGGQPVQRP